MVHSVPESEPPKGIRLVKGRKKRSQSGELKSAQPEPKQPVVEGQAVLGESESAYLQKASDIATLAYQLSKQQADFQMEREQIEKRTAEMLVEAEQRVACVLLIMER